jgi:hypothetical protein
MITNQKRKNKENFNDHCIVNLYVEEERALNKVLGELIGVNPIKLLDVEVEDIIHKHYLRCEANGSFALQSAISKIYATISGDTELLLTYTELCTDLYTYFRQLKHVLDKDLYELYVDSSKLNLHDNFDKTFLRVMCYNYNLFKEKQ